jgi:hypothetical protein
LRIIGYDTLSSSSLAVELVVEVGVVMMVALAMLMFVSPGLCIVSIFFICVGKENNACTLVAVGEGKY